MAATVLNRKFDSLCRSGTCPPCLVDVLSLLVAHANDTELFKREVRSAPVDGAGAPAAAYGTGGFFGENTPAEKDAAQHRLALIKKQTEDPEALGEAIRASHETILLAAEHSLLAFAEELRKMSELAIVSSARQLADLREATSADMDVLKQRQCAAAVEQTQKELDSLRFGWFEETNGYVAQLKQDVHEVGLSAIQEVRDMTEAYSDYVSTAYETLQVNPRLEAHEAEAGWALQQERLDALSRAAARQADVDLLVERTKQLEKTVARIGGGVLAEPKATPSAPVGGDSPARGRAAAASESPPPAAAARPSRERGAAPKAPSLPFGLRVSDGMDGVVVEEVQPDSAAAHANIAVGMLISHVGLTAVCTAADFSRAASSSDPNVKLTTFNPNDGRVRILALSP